MTVEKHLSKVSAEIFVTEKKFCMFIVQKMYNI